MPSLFDKNLVLKLHKLIGLVTRLAANVRSHTCLVESNHHTWRNNLFLFRNKFFIARTIKELFRDKKIIPK